MIPTRFAQARAGIQILATTHLCHAGLSGLRRQVGLSLGELKNQSQKQTNDGLQNEHFLKSNLLDGYSNILFPQVKKASPE